MPEKNRFSKDWLRELKNNLLELKLKGSQPCFAAFDADGTLWNSDIGENFFQFQIDHCNLPALNGIDPWVHYKNLKKENPRSAYIWLAQINKGYDLSQVRAWAKEACEKNPPEIFESQKILIHWLIENDILPIVVTASIKWAVEPAAELLGIPMERVIGVQTQIDVNKKVTELQEGPITWREGKVEGSQILSGILLETKIYWPRRADFP